MELLYYYFLCFKIVKPFPKFYWGLVDTNYMHLRYKMWWFYGYVHYEMIKKIEKIAFLFVIRTPTILPSGHSMLVLCIYEAVLLFLFTYLVLYIAHISEITHYLVFLWLILVSITSSRHIHAVTIAKFGYWIFISMKLFHFNSGISLYFLFLTIMSSLCSYFTLHLFYTSLIFMFCVI